MRNHVTVIISGKQASGKSALTNAMLKRLKCFKNITSEEFSFAQPIYKMHDMCLAVLKDYGITPAKEPKDGELLQLLGTEWGRKVQGEDIWIRIAKKRIDRFHALAEGQDRGSVAIVSDCRFRNEFNLLTDEPRTFSVRLHCDRELRKQRCPAWRDNENHPSEVDLDTYDLNGKFFMKFDTGVDSVDHINNLVMAQVLKAGG